METTTKNTALNFRVGIDESGDPGVSEKSNARDPFFVTCAALIEQEKMAHLVGGLDAIADLCFGDVAMDPFFEMHARQLAGGGDCFQGTSWTQRKLYVKEVTRLIDELDVWFVASVVEKKRLVEVPPASFHPYDVSFAGLIEELQAIAARGAARGLDPRFQIFPDTYFKPRQEKMQSRLDDAVGFDLSLSLFGPIIDAVDREMTFVNSHEDSLVQLADFAAYFIGRRLKVEHFLVRNDRRQRWLLNHFRDTTLSRVSTVTPWRNLGLPILAALQREELELA
jgi:hypothetical protein